MSSPAPGQAGDITQSYGKFGLVARRILLSSLRPPMTVTDALAYVIGQLTAAGADTVPQVAPQVRELREVRDGLSRHNRACLPGDRRRIRASVAERMNSVSSTVEQPLTVDLRLDCAVVLPEKVAREAEAAAATLALLTPYPLGFPAWQDYHTRFLERYGIGALVPVAEVVNADTGLGFPAGYRDSLQEAPAWHMSARDVRLLALAQQAAMDGDNEVVLDDRAISELAADDFTKAQMPSHTELCFHVHAPTRNSLDRGEFDLVVVGASRAAGTTTGRFLDLLDDADRDRMTGAYAELPTADTDALRAQVSCPPLYPRTENVARASEVLPRVISLAEYHTPGSNLLPLGDLAVSADAQRLCLVSLSQGRPVEPTVLNAVDFRNHTEPIARFLCEITTARAAACLPFSWGAASQLPFLPRLRYGRTVLVPARWNLPASDLPGKGASWPQWKEGMAAWRRRFRLPDTVYLGETDLRIRLDLDEDMHLALLRSHLESTGHAALSEAPDARAYGWFDGRAHEIVVPLAATSRTVWPPPPRQAAPVRTAGRDHGHLPGCSEWLFVKLYGHPDRQTDILTTSMPDLLSLWDSPPEWWFLRYRDPEPHLRLRIRLPGAHEYGQAVQHVGTWAADLRRLGLVSRVQLDTYYPETGRYGTGAAMAAAESVFAADSAAAIAQLMHTAGGSPHPQAVTAASLVDLALSLAGSVRDGMGWLINNVTTSPATPPPRAVRNEAIRLADPRDDWSALRATPGGEAVTQAWSARREALAAYSYRLAEAGEAEPCSVLPSLLHLHHIRLHSLDKDSELACHRLARAASLAWTTRHGGGAR